MGEVHEAGFRPAWWLPGPHLQTLWPLLRPRPRLALRRERVELDDGDFIDLEIGPGDGPSVVVIHGLEGGLDSHYAATTLVALATAGFRPIFMYLRGCSGEPNRLPRAYHSGASDDLAAVLAHLAGSPDGPALAAVGFSLGGNLLLKYLGETAEPRPTAMAPAPPKNTKAAGAMAVPSPRPLPEGEGEVERAPGAIFTVRAAVAVSVPFVLRDAMLRLNMGGSRIYREHLMRRLKESYRRKRSVMPDLADPGLDAMTDFFDFDDRITAPLNGFAGADDYYARCSCRAFLRDIQTPTLILHALDDPFMFSRTVPAAEELGPGVRLELARRGGHVGFVGGALPWRPAYWMEARLVAFLREIAGAAPKAVD